jgi:hypothetical protein
LPDEVLTAVCLPGTELSAEFLIPIFSMAIEIACVGVTTQRATSTATLLKI